MGDNFYFYLGKGVSSSCSITKTETSTVYTTVDAYSSYYMQSKVSREPSSNDGTPLASGLGGTVGLLVVLLAVLSIGFIFIHWNTKKTQGTKFTIAQER